MQGGNRKMLSSTDRCELGNLKYIISPGIGTKTLPVESDQVTSTELSFAVLLLEPLPKLVYKFCYSIRRCRSWLVVPAEQAHLTDLA